MKRIAITIAALSFSVTGIAVADNPDDYGSVLNDPVASTSSYNNPETYADNHGSVLLDLDLIPDNQSQRQHRSYNRGLSTEISIGDAETIFDANEGDSF